MQPPPMPTVVDSEEWFNVDQILNHRDLEVTVRRATKHKPAKTTLQREYYIKWQGYTDDHNSWEPASSVAELDALKDYLAYRNLSPVSS